MDHSDRGPSTFSSSKDVGLRISRQPDSLAHSHNSDSLESLSTFPLSDDGVC